MSSPSSKPCGNPLPKASDGVSRRAVLLTLAGGTAALLAPPIHAEPDDMAKAIHEFTGGISPQKGRIKIDVAPLVENGNSVAIAVIGESPMRAEDHIRTIALFNEKNPQPQVARFHLTPRSGTARVETRIRLATSQHLVAIARMSDGSLWSDEVEVIVTIAACTEE